MSTRWIVLFAVAVPVSGCTSLDIHPRDSDTFSSAQSPVSVPVRLDWPNGDLVQGPNVDVDGAPIQTPPLTVRPDGADATVQLPAGQHAIRVRTTQKCWYCSGGVNAYDITHTFSVTIAVPPPVPPPTASITLTMNPAALTVERGQSKPFTVDITRTNFTGPLDFAFDVNSIPVGVTVTPMSGVGTASPINSTLAIGNSAEAVQSNIKLTVHAPGGTPTANGSLALKVAPRAGPFVFRSAPTVPPTTPLKSPDNLFEAVITRQGVTRFYTAEFRPVGGQTFATISFEVQGGQLGGGGASNVSGVMFCHASPTTTAAVVSYDPSSVAPVPQFRLTTLVLTNPKQSTQRLISDFSYRFSVVPQVGFSPDCSIIGVVGVTSNPSFTALSPDGGVASFVEAQSGSSVIFTFSDLPASASVAANRTITFSTPSKGNQTRTLP
jgi:hypothetical protein